MEFNYWQGYSSIWAEVRVSYCYKMEEQNHVILREQMVSPCCFLTLVLQNGYKLCTEKKSAFFTQLKAWNNIIICK